MLHALHKLQIIPKSDNFSASDKTLLNASGKCLHDDSFNQLNLVQLSIEFCCFASKFKNFHIVIYAVTLQLVKQKTKKFSSQIEYINYAFHWQLVWITFELIMWLIFITTTFYHFPSLHLTWICVICVYQYHKIVGYNITIYTWIQRIFCVQRRRKVYIRRMKMEMNILCYCLCFSLSLFLLYFRMVFWLIIK